MALRFLNSGYFAGKVGIGTESPGASLEIGGLAADSAGLIFSSPGSEVNVNFTFIIGGTGLGLHPKNLVIKGSSGSSDIAFSPSHSYPALMVLDGSAGNVGIGTTSPNGKLTVSNGGAAGLEFFPEYTTNNNLINNYNRSNATYVALETRAAEHNWDIGTTNKMSLSSSGNLNVNGQIQGDSFSGPGEGLDNLLPVGYYATTPSSTGVLIKTNIVSNNYGFMFGELKLEQFNFASTQTVSFSATVNSNGTVITKAAVADIAITIKLFAYGGEWWIWVPTATTYITVSAFIYTGAGYQGQYKGFNEVYSVIGGSVPSTGVTGSVDIVADVYVTTSSAGGSGPFLPLSAGSSYPLTDTLYVRENGNKNNGTISMGLGGSGTTKWSFLTGTHYNQATGSGNGTGSAGMAIIGSLATETYNRVYIGGGPYEINAATQIDFWTHSSPLSTQGGTRKGYVDAGGNWFLGDTLWVDAADDYVGIGTTTPAAPLHVLDDSSANVLAKIRIQGDSTSGYGDIGMQSGYIRLFSNGSMCSAWTGGVQYNYINGSTATTLTSTGFGIGVTSPGAKLDIVGSSLGIRVKKADLSDVLRVYTQGSGIFMDNGNVHISDDLKIGATLLSNQENTDIDSAAAEVVAQVSITDYTAAFFDFVVKKGTNVRSGTVYACHDGTNVEFTETSTNDLGDTSDVTLSVDKTSTNLRLIATVTSDDWSVKSLIRAI